MEELFTPYFTLERSINMIKLISKNKGINNTIASLMSTNYNNLVSTVDDGNWKITYYNYNKDKEKYIIEIIPKKISNVFSEGVNLYINHFNNLYLDKHIDDEGLIQDNDYLHNDKMLAVFPKRPTERWFTFMHRYNYDKVPVFTTPIKVGTTSFDIKDMNNTLLQEPISYELEPGERAIGYMEIDANYQLIYPNTKYFLIEVPKTEITNADTSFVNNLFIIPDVFIYASDPESDDHWFDSWLDSFLDDPWMIHSKLLDQLLKTSIGRFSSPDDIIYLQELINKYYNKEMVIVNGVYDENLMSLIAAYQKEKGITFGLGILDVETEAMLINDIKAIENN